MTRSTSETHSKSGIDLVRRLAAEGHRIFSVQTARQLAAEVGLSDSYVVEALHHLSRAGWIVRLKRGLYALASTTPGVVPTHEFEIAMALVQPAAIGFWSALHFHGLTEQLPGTVFVLTTTDTHVPRDSGRSGGHRSSGFSAAGFQYRFIQVQPDRYFGVTKTWVGEARISITDPERTLLDGLSRPRLCGDIGEVLNGFEIRKAELDLERIIDYALRMDDAVTKRLGWVLDHLQIETRLLEPLLSAPVRGYRTLDASGPRKGPRCRRWMIQENLPGNLLR